MAHDAAVGALYRDLDASTEGGDMSETAARRGIVVGVDGSSSSMAAVEWASRDAALRDEPLTLVHVLMRPVVATLPGVALPTGFQRWQEERGDRIIDDAAAIAEKVVTPKRVQIERRMVTGVTIKLLAEMSRTARMVVVGCHGHGRLRRLLGSVAFGMAQYGHGPVVVVHDEDLLLPDSAFAPVVVGIDGSPVSEAATALAFDEASRRGVDLVAVHACMTWSGDELPFDERGDLEAHGPELLTKCLTGWRQRYPEVEVRTVVVPDHAAEHLVEQSKRAQLVVVGTHGFGGFTGMLLGSVSSAVVQSAHAPVAVGRER
jgi:nucleotide-binding universal stress UspA family protein